jgi:hypothetical protein
LNRSKDKLKNKEVLKQARGYSYQQPTNQMLAASPLSRKNRHSLSRFNRRQQLASTTPFATLRQRTQIISSVDPPMYLSIQWILHMETPHQVGHRFPLKGQLWHSPNFVDTLHNAI